MHFPPTPTLYLLILYKSTTSYSFPITLVFFILYRYFSLFLSFTFLPPSLPLFNLLLVLPKSLLYFFFSSLFDFYLYFSFFFCVFPTLPAHFFVFLYFSLFFGSFPTPQPPLFFLLLPLFWHFSIFPPTTRSLLRHIPLPLAFIHQPQKDFLILLYFPSSLILSSPSFFTFPSLLKNFLTTFTFRNTFLPPKLFLLFLSI